MAAWKVKVRIRDLKHLQEPFWEEEVAVLAPNEKEARARALDIMEDRYKARWWAKYEFVADEPRERIG